MKLSAKRIIKGYVQGAVSVLELAARNSFRESLLDQKAVRCQLKNFAVLRTAAHPGPSFPFDRNQLVVDLQDVVGPAGEAMPRGGTLTG